MDSERETLNGEIFIERANNQLKCIFLAPNYFTY
jgi:hypothetical protein